MNTCWICRGTGKYEKPYDEEKFDALFDKYDGYGFLSMGECREKALEEVGYEMIICPNCNGLGKTNYK